MSSQERPGEVRRLLRQELLKKVGHSDWDGPRLYRYNLAEEREPARSVQSMVVIPSESEQPEAEHEAVASQDQKPSSLDLGPDRRIVSTELVSSPLTSLPTKPAERSRPGRPSGGSLVNSFPLVELWAPP